MVLLGNHCCFKDVIESHEWSSTSLSNALSCFIVVLQDLPGLGLFSTSLAAVYLFNSLEMMEIICHLVPLTIYDVP